MMVEILTSVSGKDFSYSVGEVIDLDSDTANDWIEHGICKPVEVEKPEPRKAQTRKRK